VGAAAALARSAGENSRLTVELKFRSRSKQHLLDPNMALTSIESIIFTDGLQLEYIILALFERY